MSGDITVDHSRSKDLDECPKFYKNDITSILRERNELKEKVIELEEEIVTLKREISRLSNFGTLTLSPNTMPVRRTRADAFLDVSQNKEQPRSAAVAMLQKTLKSCTDTRPRVSDVEITGYKKKGRHYVYVIKLTWSDGQRYEIYRRYGEFFTFQHVLLQLFPEESGKGNSAIRIIPSLPTIDNVLSLFGRTNTESIMKTRLATISEYCQILLLHLDEQISRSPHVLSFFRPTIGDTQLTKLKRKLSGVDLSMLSVYPQDMPAGCLFEEFVVLADYDATTTGEISAKAGEKVKVIKKEDSGWWLITKGTSSNNRDNIGYISRDYLKPYKDQDIWKSMSSDDLQKYLGLTCDENLGPEDTKAMQLKYVAVEDYHTEDPRQLPLEKDEMVLVVETSEDGWWLVLCNKKQGWVPASYLQPLREGQQGEFKQEDNTLEATSGTERGEDYIALASYCGEHDDDISFPKGATVEVLEKNPIGWWVVRHKEKIGVAPASFLQLPCTPDIQIASSIDIGQSISGIAVPPPRSKIFLHDTTKKISELSLSFRDKEQSGAMLSHQLKLLHGQEY